MRTPIAAAVFAAVLAASPVLPLERSGFGLDVLVRGTPRPELRGNGTVYIEALKGREYVLRLTNPLPRRVAVALSVDGLNTIDAEHGDARTASKWILEPYQTIEIAGWQVSGDEARKFYFTGERSSYGAWLGKTENLGVIEAVFFAERLPEPRFQPGAPVLREKRRSEAWPGSAGSAAPVPAPSADRARAESDELAATGIGDRTEHRVNRVHLALEPTPTAHLRLRYEFRPQLVELGLLPPIERQSRLDRRERARGFEGTFCPEPR